MRMPPKATAASLAPPAWHAAIARALERGSSTPTSRYLQIATVRPDGRPAVRSVVFRGWFDGEDDVEEWRSGSGTVAAAPRLGFVTDARTAKVEHASLNPRAEACWYFAEARSQFRLSGTLMVIGALAADADARAARLRLSAWEKLSPGSREWHSSPAAGSPKVSGGEGEGEGEGSGKTISAPAAEVRGGDGGEETASETPEPPHEYFCLVLLDIDGVDHVDLEKDERTLWELEREGGESIKKGKWRSRVVWP